MPLSHFVFCALQYGFTSVVSFGVFSCTRTQLSEIVFLQSQNSRRKNSKVLRWPETKDCWSSDTEWCRSGGQRQIQVSDPAHYFRCSVGFSLMCAWLNSVLCVCVIQIICSSVLCGISSTQLVYCPPTSKSVSHIISSKELDTAVDYLYSTSRFLLSTTL